MIGGTDNWEGWHDYDDERMKDFSEEDFEKLTKISAKDKEMANMIKKYIKKGKLYVTDKDNMIVWPCSFVRGYDNGLLIGHER